VAKTILVVDDEKNIVDILTFNLEREGYRVLCAYDGKKGLELALGASPDLVLLDVMLPYMNGFEVCREIRLRDKLTPVILLTAREEESDKIFGLELGADDYVVKPFSLKELLEDAPGEESLAPLCVGRLTVDLNRLRVRKDELTLDLTQREYDIVKFMALSPGKVFSREELMSGVWNYDYFGDIRLVDVAMRRLREKVEDDPASPAILVTKRGMGYYLSEESQENK
jgi:two-component system response regulator VicR